VQTPGLPRVAVDQERGRRTRPLPTSGPSEPADRSPVGPGSRLGPYEVIAPLEAAGMGEVFLALDTRLKRHVAVNELGAWILFP